MLDFIYFCMLPRKTGNPVLPALFLRLGTAVKTDM